MPCSRTVCLLLVSLGGLLAACGDRVTRPFAASMPSMHRSNLLTPVALDVPDTVDMGVPIEIGARFAEDTRPCSFLSVVGWTGGNHVMLMWNGSATRTNVCTAPTLRWTPISTWRTADMPPHLGRLLIIACTAEGTTIAKPVVVRMVERDGADTLRLDAAPDDLIAETELRLRTRGCAE